MGKVLVGTFNPAKSVEMSAFLKAEGFEVVTLAETDLGDIEETGATFEENALLKARYYAEQSGLVTVADDSGFEVDALNGAPGIKSKRWIGEDATWEDLARAIIERTEDVPAGERGARLHTVMAAVTPDGELRTAEAAIEGRIPPTLDESKIAAGYPYRALLIVDGYDKLYADLTEEEHDQVNQRRKALGELLPFLREAVK